MVRTGTAPFPTCSSGAWHPRRIFATSSASPRLPQGVAITKMGVIYYSGKYRDRIRDHHVNYGGQKYDSHYDAPSLLSQFAECGVLIRPARVDSISGLLRGRETLRERTGIAGFVAMAAIAALMIAASPAGAGIVDNPNYHYCGATRVWWKAGCRPTVPCPPGMVGRWGGPNAFNIKNCQKPGTRSSAS